MDTENPVKVIVTPEDIDQGKPNYATACPIALALIHSGLESPEVQPLLVRVYDHDQTSYEAILPDDAVEFIRQFDNDGNPGPFSFDLTFYRLENFNDD